MGFLVSPGVEVNEVDMTNVIPAVSTSIGGYAGPFRWGPVDKIVTVSSEKDLVSVYGKPDAAFAESFFTAASFLKYGNALKVSRAWDTSMKNAIAGPPNFAIFQLKIATTTTSRFVTIYETSSLLVAGLEINYINSAGVYGLTLGEIDSVAITVANTVTGAAAFTTITLVANATAALAVGTNLQIWNQGAYDTAGGSILVKASEDFKVTRSALTIPFVARYPGAFGNGLNVVIVTNYSTLNAANAPDINPWALQFDYQPDVNEIHILIVDYTGVFTGTAGSILEKYTGLSTVTTAKRADGTNNYYKDVLNDSSLYVFAAATITINTTTGTSGTAGIAQIYDFIGGVDSSTATTMTSGTATALDLFADAEIVDVNLIFAYGTADSKSTPEGKLQEISTSRKDCVAFISAPITINMVTSEAERLGKIVTKFFGTASIASTIMRNSYSVFDSSPLYVYNKYLDNYLWIPACGHMAGLCANTDDVAEPWFSPAGYTRGQLLGVTKLGFNPNQASRDIIYKMGVNPICAFPGQGIILYGDKTAQAKPSAFDRINVRRLFIVLEKAIATASKYQLFELNDEFTRAMFRNMVEPFLRDVKGRRGITDFLVVCDETNNTGVVIDTNRFVADIYIKPARSINFITLNFIATRTGVQFSEIVGK